MSRFHLNVLLAFSLLPMFGCGGDGGDGGAQPEETGDTTGAAETNETITDATTAASAESETANADANQAGKQGSELAGGGAALPAVETQIAQLVRQRKLEEALKLVEQHAAKEDASAELLELAAQVYQSHGLQTLQTGGGEQELIEIFTKSWEYGKRLLAKRPELKGTSQNALNNVFYNGACAMALSGRKDEAIAALNQSLELGFDDLGLITSDKTLAAVKETDGFKAVVGAIVKNAFAKTKPFDFDFSLPDLDGKAVSLGDHKGKVVIVDFWGTWCPPCREEIPHFIELQEKYGEQGLQIVGLTYERGNAEEAPAKVRKYMTEAGINYPCVLGDEATQQQVPNFNAFPTTLFLDKTGKVRLRLVGLQPASTLEAYAKVLLDE